MRPDLCHIEDIPSELFCLGRIHHLHIDVPDRMVARLDGLKQVLDEVVRILARNLDRLFSGHVLNAESRLDMDLDIFERTILVPHE